MFSSVWDTLKKGIDKIRGNPQLLYTVLVAILIVGAFVFMAERFVSIANDAQERLVNVRVGALQDAFVTFAGDRIADTPYLNEKIQDILATNETIKDFTVLTKEMNATASSSSQSPYTVIASGNLGGPITPDGEADFLYMLATSDPSHSVTIELKENGERFFKTARAITDANGTVVGVVMTKQTLSQADQAIEQTITNSMILLTGILIVIMLLFLRFSKVIDYMALYQKLKEVDQLKDDFISMASHELRSPLTVIRGYAEFIKESKELLPETQRYVSMIDTAAKGLDALIADILDVSRMEQGRMSFALAPMNPNALVSEIVQSFEIPAHDKGLAISSEATAIPPETTINVDTDRLKQVLVNLVGNAVKYTVHGEIKVTQTIEKGMVSIRVSDTGLGMTAEERERLFEKFYRIKTEETKDIRGTGLGLWITAKIVKEMSGTLTVESIKGVGSHFIVSFPVVV